MNTFAARSRRTSRRSAAAVAAATTPADRPVPARIAVSFPPTARIQTCPGTADAPDNVRARPPAAQELPARKRRFWNRRKSSLAQRELLEGKEKSSKGWETFRRSGKHFEGLGNFSNGWKTSRTDEKALERLGYFWNGRKSPE